MSPDPTPPPRVLIIAAAHRRHAHQSLRAAGFETVGAPSPTDALEMLSAQGDRIDAVVLHWPDDLRAAVQQLHRPGLTGHKLPAHIPLVVIADREPDVVAALEAGAVDFAPLSELDDSTLATRVLARIHATKARQSELADLGGGWTVEVTRHRFTHPDGRAVQLTPQVFAAFEALWQRRGHVVEIHNLLEQAWHTLHVTVSAVHSTAAQIRHDLPADCSWELRNERGIGYLIAEK